MLITKAAIKWKQAVFLLMMVFIIFGSSAYISLPREANPDVPIPYIFITTIYSGFLINLLLKHLLCFQIYPAFHQLFSLNQYTNAKEIEDIVVTVKNGIPVYLRDVARVLDSFEDKDSYASLNGVPAISVSIKKY